MTSAMDIARSRISRFCLLLAVVLYFALAYSLTARQAPSSAVPGEFAILVGSSSVDIGLQGKYSLGPGGENR